MGEWKEAEVLWVSGRKRKWEAGPKNWWEVELLRGGLSEVVRDWPPKTDGLRLMPHTPLMCFSAFTHQ